MGPLILGFDPLPPGLLEFLSSLPGRWLLLVALLVITWIVARVVSRTLLARLMRLRHVETAIVQLIARLFVFGCLVAGVFAYAAALFRADLAALATTLGLFSLAVGFGLQNTIANVAGGISLAVDRPFRIGDMIRIGEVEGDVQEIGIRSTRLITARQEFVVIPNKYLEEQPILNYTMVYPDLRLDVPVGIGYEADRARAEELLVEAALAHPVVLRKPPPRVLLRRFGESSVDLELRCWISHPRNQLVVQSDLLKGIQDRLDAAGIEIPYPRRVVLQREDRPKTSRAGGVRKALQRPPPRILCPLQGPEPDRARTQFAVGLAKALQAHLVAVYVADEGARLPGQEGSRALQAIGREAEAHGIWFKPILRPAGDVAQAVAETAAEEDVDLILLGLHRPRSVFDWPRRHAAPAVDEAALKALGVHAPVHEVPFTAKVNPALVAELESRIREHRRSEQEPDASAGAAAPAGGPGPPPGSPGAGGGESTAPPAKPPEA